MAQRQVNIRLAEEDVEILEAAAYLGGGTMPDLVRGVLDAEVERLRSQPRVQKALQLRAEQTAENEGVLRPLDARRKGHRSGDGPAS